MLFYGIDDAVQSETWEASEKLVTDFCESKLGINLTSLTRAHHIGRFSESKQRPIIAKLMNDKEIDSILSKGYKLKGITLSIFCDYSTSVRAKRKHFLAFSETIKKDGNRINLRFHNLFHNSLVYVWDSDSGRPVQLNVRATNVKE